MPMLQRHGFTATFYIVNAFVGQPGYMTWDQIASLRDAGMEIGAHTLDHLMLTRLELGEMQRQISQSKLELEKRLGIRVHSFSYPVGDYDWTVEEQVRAAGYENAATTRWDDNYADALGLPRRRVAGGTTVDELVWIVTN
jgi:peptidoglycan/xylan/chitin deacetylase (PgdA/CDA1 family)